MSDEDDALLESSRLTADSLIAKVARAPAVPDPIGQTIGGRYRVGGLLGQGGMGRVFEAEDLELQRPVAMKFLRSRADGEPLERFLHERTVTAGLEHPGIVPVYDAGLGPGGQPFYVMRVARGEPLDRLIEKAATLEARLALIPNVIAIAEAVAFAHSHGIVHRDLKPANVLVGSFGETLVADWGLAGPIESRAAGVVGTPAYMAPEQAAGAPVDERGDVYALGATLLHVVTGEPPRARGDADRAALLAGVPGDVIAILDKALAREPAARYQTAAELAGELRRFETGQMVAARRYTRAERLRRWVRRRRSEVILGLALGLILAVVVAGSVVRIVAERNVAVAQHAEAEAARRETATRNEELLLLQARSELTRDPTASLAWLKRYPPRAAGWDTAVALASDAWSRGVAHEVWDLGRPIGSVAIAPDGRTVAAGAVDGTLVFIDVATGTRRVFHADDGVGDRVVFSPDGVRVATTDVENVRLWDVATGASRRLEGEHIGGPTVGFSPDGSMLLARHPGTATRLWRVPSGEPLSLSSVAGAFYAFLPGGVAVAAGNSLELVDPSSSAVLARTHLPSPARDLQSPPTGDWVGAPIEDGLFVWRPASGEVTRIAAEPGAVTLIVPSPDGRRVVGCTTKFQASSTLWAFDIAAGSASQLSSDERCTRQAFSFSPDGARFVSAGFGAELRVHEIAERRTTRLLGHDGSLSDAVFAPDGKAIVSASWDHTVRLWRRGEGDLRILRDVNALDRVAATGEILISDIHDGTVSLIDSASGRRRVLSGPRPPGLRDLGTLSLDGGTAAFPVEGAFVVWDTRAAKGRMLAAGTNLASETVAVQSADGTALAQADAHGRLRIVDLVTGRARDLPPLADAGFALAWSADGHLLAAGGRDGTARVHDVESGAERAVLRVPGWVWGLSFSPDGTRLAAAGSDGGVRVLDLGTKAVMVLEGHVGNTMGVDFTRDGRRVVSAGTDGTVRLWDLATGRGEVVAREPAAVNLAAFSPDGRVLMIRSFFKVRFVDAATLPPLDPDAAAVKTWIGERTSAEVDGRGFVKTP